MSNDETKATARTRRGIPRALPREDIRSSQTSALEPLTGRIEKVRLGQRAFADASKIIAGLPEVFLGRSLIVSDRGAVNAVCRQDGHVYAITAAAGPQVRILVDAGFRPLDMAGFPIFADDPAEAAAYQKRVTVGESLSFGDWVLLIFGPEERGGVADGRLRPLVPPAHLPDGTEFKTWEVPPAVWASLYVNQAHPEASDSNPGSAELPLLTINRAAQLLEPGQRVRVSAGVYRECVRPVRGGTDPDHMIIYEAEPGEKVVISGSERLEVPWVHSAPYVQDLETPVEPTVARLWMASLPPELFQGYNPFATANYRQLMTYWKLPDLFSKPKSRLFFQVTGLLFQDGMRLEQVDYHTELFTREGAFWVETDGLTIHISPHGGIDPNLAEWEATAREQLFAPEEHHLGYIKVSGFTLEHAANSFPFPQRGALSTTMGHHWIIENNTIQWVNSVGIDIGNQGYPPIRRPEILGYHIVRGNTLNDIGICGIAGPGPHGSLIEDNVFRRNAWHDVEFVAECAAIKTHQNQNVLIRRNLVFDTLYGTGIYIDYQNSNSRICQNVIVNTGSRNGPGPGEGGIYVEHAQDPVMVDHNFVWGSTLSNGIYAYQCTKLTVAYNMVGNCRAVAIWVLDMLGRGSTPGGNTVLNNIVANNGWQIGFYTSDNVSDHNLIGEATEEQPFRLGLAPADYEGYPPPRKGTRYAKYLDLDTWRGAYEFDQHGTSAAISVEFNPDTLELAWSVGDAIVEATPIDGTDRDFWGRPTTGRPIVPGPFGDLPTHTARIIVDPRPSAGPDGGRTT